MASWPRRVRKHHHHRLFISHTHTVPTLALLRAGSRLLTSSSLLSFLSCPGEDRKSKKALHQAMRRSDLKRRSSKRRKHVHMSWAPSDFEWPMGLPMDLPGLDGGEEGGDVWNIGQAN